MQHFSAFRWWLTSLWFECLVRGNTRVLRAQVAFDGFVVMSGQRNTELNRFSREIQNPIGFLKFQCV